MIEIIWFIAISIIALVIYARWLYGGKTVNLADARLVVSRALKQLNCNAEWDKDNDSRTARFTYQGGHFNLTLAKDNPYARLSFLFFFEADVADIELVRTVCNLCNLNTDTARVVYTIDNKKSKVDLHLICSLPVMQGNIKDELERCMADVFRWQNAFVSKYKDMEKEAGKKHGVDFEKSDAEYSRIIQLIREQEMTHQDGGPDWHESVGDRKTLSGLLSMAMGLTDIIPIKLALTIDDQLTEMDDPDAILGYNISTPLIGEGSSFIHTSATGKLDFYDPNDPVTVRHLILDFEKERSDSDTLYYRITLTLVPVSLSKTVDENSEQHAKHTTSVLLGYDLTPSKKRLAHFRYVWKEAMGKQQNDDTKDMTEEEKAIADIQDPHLAYNYYHGRNLFLRKRFYEALLPLKNAFHAVTDLYHNHDKHTLEMIDELAFYIGSCYMSLHQYDRACYYLQLLLPTNHQSFTEAYINCLVNGNDFRAMDILNGLLGTLQMMMDHANEEEDGEEDNDNENDKPTDKQQLQGFINFVKRRKAFLLINQKRYDEAERILKQLLDDPDNSDFALNELAYIQKKGPTPARQ